MSREAKALEYTGHCLAIGLRIAGQHNIHSNSHGGKGILEGDVTHVITCQCPIWAVASRESWIHRSDWLIWMSPWLPFK